MKIEHIKKNAFSMPLFQPAYPNGPYRFINREYLIITYETDIEKLKAIVPEPLEVIEPVVKYEFIKMPDSTGFGDYTESGQVIPVSFNGVKGNYTHCMYLDGQMPISAGREIWGFPKMLAHPKLQVKNDVLQGELFYQDTRVALGTMGYKHTELNKKTIKDGLECPPNFLLKIIPHVDGTARVNELVEYHLTDVLVKGAWSGPAELEFTNHVMAPVAHLPIKKVVSAVHIIADITLPYGKVVHNYLDP